MTSDYASVLVFLALGLSSPTRVAAAVETENTAADPAQRFAQAQRLKNSGAQDAALQQLNSLRADFPGDVDYALARAHLLAQLGRDDEALDELLVATRLAPNYEAVWELRLTILARQEGKEAKADRAALQQEVAERFPDALWWQNSTSDDIERWTLLVGASRETLSNNQPDWNSEFVELQLDKNSAGQYRVRLGRDERFAGADLTFGVGGEYSWSSRWFAGAELSVAGSPKFQPEFGYAVHAGKTLTGGWVVDLRYRLREYPGVKVGSVTATVENYFSDFRIAYGLGVSRLQGSASLPNHALTANWFYSEHASVGITINTGQEAEAIGNGQVLESDVRGISMSGRRNLGGRFGLQWWLGVHEQGDFYGRRFLGLAVSYQL